MPGMPMQLEEFWGKLGPQFLFNLTGKFSRPSALRVMNQAASIFLLSIREMGGEVLDDPKNYSNWGMACGLPGAQAFSIVKNCVVSCDWAVRAERSDGVYLVLTSRGVERCTELEELLSPKGGDSA